MNEKPISQADLENVADSLASQFKTIEPVPLSMSYRSSQPQPQPNYQIICSYSRSHTRYSSALRSAPASAQTSTQRRNRSVVLFNKQDNSDHEQHAQQYEKSHV